MCQGQHFPVAVWVVGSGIVVGGCNIRITLSRKTKTFERQNRFSIEDLIEGEHVPFLNIFSRGYPSRLAA
eukprot:5719059-Ditylum_brightwellii.AAC.1